MLAARYDISPYIAVDTIIRLVRAPAMTAAAQIYIDTVDIDLRGVPEGNYQADPPAQPIRMDENAAVDWAAAAPHRLYLPLVAESMAAAHALPAPPAVPAEVQAAMGAAVKDVYDTFTQASWSNNHGSVSWASSWIETGEPYAYPTPNSGDIQIPPMGRPWMVLPSPTLWHRVIIFLPCFRVVIATWPWRTPPTN